MKKKQLLDADKILNTKFTPNVKGYNALEVDEMLDKVIKDYDFFDETKKQLQSEITRLNNLVKKLQKKNTDLEAIVATQKEKLARTPNVPTKATTNMELLHKVSAYERKFHELGIDPRKLL
jgi:DivIVA domain-containing protein